MSPIQREINKLGRALRELPEDRQSVLHAAQQALAWALESKLVMRPPLALTRSEEADRGCSARIHRQT